MSSFEVLNKNGVGPFFLTCEHASNRIDAKPLSNSDRELQKQHWGYDIGIAPVTRILAEHLDAPAVLSNFSRLLIDPNRDPDSETLIPSHCADIEIGLNRGLSDAERQKRIDDYYTPFHTMLSNSLREAQSAKSRFLLSLHSFTPVYSGQKRDMDIGILFNRYEDRAERLASVLRAEFQVALNQPYSGFDGLIYSAEHHAGKADIPYLEIEVRQDLVESEEGQAAIAQRLAAAVPVLVPA